MDIEPVMLVGRRSDGGQRDRVWEFCRGWWQSTLPYPIYEGHHDEGDYSMAVASNRAYELACEGTPDWNVALYFGADYILDSHMHAIHALDISLRKRCLTFAHDRQYRLEEDETEAVLDGATPYPGSEKVHRNSFSQVLAVSRALWEEVGGFDERFNSWGGEDIAFWCACWAMRGFFERVKGQVFHLWHPRPVEDQRQEPLMMRYLDAKTSKTKMLQILGER
jgi:hypothetical protein